MAKKRPKTQQRFNAQQRVLYYAVRRTSSIEVCIETAVAATAIALCFSGK